MNVAIFVQSYLPIDVYGIPRHIERLSNYLSAKGHKIWIVTRGYLNLKKIERVNDNLIIFRTFHPSIKKLKWFGFFNNFWDKYFYSLMSLIEGLRLIKKNKIQILHGHHLEYGGFQSFIIGKISNKPVLITIHGSGLDYYSGYHKIPLKLRFLKSTQVKIICQKKAAIKILEKWMVPKEKIEFITEAFVDTEKFNPIRRIIHKKYKFISFIGRLIQFKGPILLINAIPMVIKEFQNIKFLFVGEGDLLQALKQKVNELDIQDYVKFLGVIKNIEKIYSITDISLLLSTHENYTDMTLLEALSFEIPIIATNVGETSTIIKNGITGLLTSCSPEEIAEKICLLLKDAAFSNFLGKNGRKLILSNYNMEKFGKIHENLYKNFYSECNLKN